MKPLAFILSIAIPAVVLSADVTPAFATKMNGKCCQWSDGGRSYRYRTALMNAHLPRTCSAYAASCIRYSEEHGYTPHVCFAARGECLQRGVYVGPFSGRQFSEMQRM
jgi:hypothetical protein